jgi:hypothetical protein
VSDQADPGRCPPLADLLLAVEQELPAARQAVVQTHLQHCEACQQSVARTNSYVEAYESERGEDRTAERLVRFRERVRTEQRARVARSLRVPSLRRWLPIAAVVPLLVVGALLSRKYTAVVQAEELLTRAVAQERRVPAGTIQQVRIRLTPPGVQVKAVSLVREIGDHAVARTVSGRPGIGDPSEPVADEATLERLLTTNNFDWRRPLNVDRFQTWRASLTRKKDSVMLTGDSLLVLRTTTTEGMLREAELTVRRDDFHAVRQALVLDGIGRIEIEEVSAWITPSSSVASTLVASAKQNTTDTQDARAALDGETLDDAELDARIALRVLGADLLPHVRVARSVRGITIDGTVPSARQKQALVSRFASLAHVQTMLRVAPDAAGGVAAGAKIGPGLSRWLARTFGQVSIDSGAAGLAGAGTPDATNTAGNNTATINTAALGVGPADSAADRYLPDVMSAAAAVQQRVAALRTLASRYPETVVDRLSPAAQAKLQMLVDAHYRALASHMDRLDNHLALILGSTTRMKWAAHAPEAWQQHVAAAVAPTGRLIAAVQALPSVQEELPLPPEVQRGAAEPAIMIDLRTSFSAVWDALSGSSST